MALKIRILAGLLALVLQHILEVDAASLAPYTSLATPVSQRAPTSADDSTRGYSAIGSLASIRVSAAGSGYTTLSAALSGGGCSKYGALSVVLSGSVLSGVTDDGTTRGCTSAPTVTFTGDGSGASAVANVGLGSDWLTADGKLYTAQDVTAGAAMWQPNTGADALPGDSIGTPLAAWGARRIVSAYGTGSAFDVQFTSGGTVSTISFLSSGLPDYTTLDALTSVAGVVARVVKVYDQSGNGYHLTAAFASAPTIGSLNIIGNARSIAFDTSLHGTVTTEYMTVPSGLTATSNADSVIGLLSQRSTLAATSLIELTGTTKQAIGMSATSALWNYVFGTPSTIQQMPSLTPFVAGFSSGSANNYVFLDDALTRTGFGSAVSLAGGYVGGGSSPVITGADGYIELGALIVTARALTSVDIGRGKASLYKIFGTFPQVKDVLVYDGDSITEGYGSTLMQNYSKQASSLLSYPWRVYVNGAFGQTTTQRLAAYSTFPAKEYNPLARNNDIINFLGTNDLNSGSTPAAAYSNQTSYVGLAHATGYRVGLATMLNRSTVDESSLRVPYNTLIKGGSAGNDFLINNDTTPFGQAGSAASSVYTVDGTHPTNFGYGYVATSMSGAINAQIRR